MKPEFPSSGPLIFAVYNAGPATIHLQRGMPLFLLWMADLDEASDKRKSKPGPAGIPPVMINNITGVVDSVYALEKRVKEELKELRDKYDTLRDRISEMTQRQTRVLIGLSIAAVLGGAVVGLLVKGLFDDVLPPPAPAAISAPAPSTQVRPAPARPPQAQPVTASQNSQ